MESVIGKTVYRRSFHPAMGGGGGGGGGGRRLGKGLKMGDCGLLSNGEK